MRVATVQRLRRVGKVSRYRQIAAVLIRHGFVDVAEALHLAPPLTAGRRLLAAVGRPVPPVLGRPERIRMTLEELGPTFVKFGQALSTRADLLPDDVLRQLVLLQDAVPPLGPGVAERTIEQSLGRAVDELFASFDPVPVAAASIAQVHRARLPSGDEVAVKVRRPGIGAVIESDLAILEHLAALAEHHLPDTRLYGPEALVAEFARTIRREQDLAREGRILARFASHFAGDAAVCFPRVYWPYTTPDILTMEFLDGVKVSAVGTEAAPDLDPAVVARRGADAVLAQILAHGLFHADPHPGNILVLPGNVVAFIDVGIVGRVNRRMRRTLSATIEAIWERDAERLAEIVVSVATPRQPPDMAELTRDLEEILDVYSDLSLGDLSLGAALSAAAATVQRHQLRFPADLLLLVKAIATIEGVGLGLDPSFKMVEHAMPMVRRLAIERGRPGAVGRRVARAGREAARLMRRLPRDLAALTRKARGEGLTVQFVHRNLDYFVREMDRSSNRLSFAIVIGAIVVGSSVVMHAGLGPRAFGYPSLGLAGFVMAGLLGVGLAIGILRSGRL